MKTNKTSEMIDIYDMDHKYVGTQNRTYFLQQAKKDFFEKKQINYLVKSVGALLINDNKELYLVQRGETENSPGLIDKTVGGHVSSGETFDQTLEREFKEEIGLDAIITRDENEFRDILNVVDTTKVAVLLLIDNLSRMMVNSETIPNYQRCFNAAIYMGIYNGEINQFPDGTSKECIKVPMSIALDEVHTKNKVYTESLGFLLEKYNDLILSKIG